MDDLAFMAYLFQRFGNGLFSFYQSVGAGWLGFQVEDNPQILQMDAD
jgi:hypothetical protein